MFSLLVWDGACQACPERSRPGEAKLHRLFLIDWHSKSGYDVGSIPDFSENSMARVLVLYKTPKDTAAFDRHYSQTHIPVAKKIPGLRKYEISQGPVTSPTGASGVHLVATLHFDDMAAVQKAFGSPEGQAAAADVQQNLGSADILLFDSREV